MQKKPSTSDSLFALGCLALIGGTVLSYVLDRHSGAPVLGCAAVILAVAWMFERGIPAPGASTEDDD